MHYNKIDTEWDDPDGWGRQTTPFLNTLNPVTGNLVEHAVRVRSAYQSPVIQQFIYKVDRRIRAILESSKGHDSHTFNIDNYSSQDLAKISDYVKNVLRLFRMYYQTADEDQMLDSLKCVNMSVGNLADMLDRIDVAVEKKLTPLCMTESMKHDIRNLVTLMDLVEQQAEVRGNEKSNSPQVAPHQKAVRIPSLSLHSEPKENEVDHHGPKIGEFEHAPGVSNKFYNPGHASPPMELKNVACHISVEFQNAREAATVAKILKKRGRLISITESDGKAKLLISPSDLALEEELTVSGIEEMIDGVKETLKQMGYSESRTERDEFGWLQSDWVKL